MLVLTRDTASLRLLSQKILRLNNKISRLIGINEGMYPTPEKKKKKIRLKNNKNEDSDEEYKEYGIEEYKFDNPLLKKRRRKEKKRRRKIKRNEKENDRTSKKIKITKR